ncbi:chemotaxis protein CheB [Sphaerisporangium flaviroseum]|uniref:protein-glutamate methylesterase n=1 Tax=Sphaerisporangium flaviroseum TaxID=509199 RepID=A0ABP7HEB8_9ACTN
MAIIPGRDLVVVAASAGGVESLRALLARLPGDLGAAVLVVLHISPHGGTALAGILDRAGPLRAANAQDGEPLKHGRVYVAPADHHLLVTGETVRLSRGPRHNGHRPAADPLFQSAALAGGPRTMAVVCSGTLDDGAQGSAVVERLGGAVAVQDPDESAFDGMPRAALAKTGKPHVGTVEQIATWILRQSRTPVEVTAGGGPADPELERQVSLWLSSTGTGAPQGRLSEFSCPECSGPLYEAGDGGGETRYECLIGHTWSLEAMIDGQGAAVERALGIASLRLEQRIRVMDRMLISAEQRGRASSVRWFREQGALDREALRTLRELQAKIGQSLSPAWDDGHREQLDR